MSRKIKPFLSLNLILILLCGFWGCIGTPNQSAADEGILNFAEYESDELYDIERVSLIGALGSKCATYKFTYLSDYYEIKGYISIPNSVSKAEPGKCILFNRGGNSSIGVLEDGDTAKICVESNRIVIASQYRGAGGSGGKDQYGGDDLHDVIKLIDFCEQFDFADMTDFCAVGVSRGGVMTYMSARQDGRIKRIVAVSAVSDLFSSYRERQDMRDVLVEYIGCRPDDNPYEYERRSAVYWTDDIKVPVLLIHSRQDKQVSFQQSEKMYEKLKDSTDCTFITHDDDLHGAHSEDLEKITEWLEK